MGLRNRNLLIDERCFFVTTTCKGWLKMLDIGQNKVIISNSVNFVCQKYQVDVLGYVLMPNHIHLIFYFKQENKLSDLMRDFKKFTSVQIRKEIENKQPAFLDNLRIRKQERVFQVWQDRFDDVWLRDKNLLEVKLDYIHLYPLQAHWNLVKLPQEYEDSSAMLLFAGATTKNSGNRL